MGLVCAVGLLGGTCCLLYLGQLSWGGRRGSGWLLEVVSVVLGWLKMVLPWQIPQWGNVRLEGVHKKSSAKGGSNVKRN